MRTNQMMDLCEEMLRANVVKVLGTAGVRYGEHELDFAKPFERLTMKEAIRKMERRVLRSLISMILVGLNWRSCSKRRRTHPGPAHVYYRFSQACLSTLEGLP